MRSISLVILLLLALKSYSQRNLYTFNNGSFVEEDKIKLYFDAAKKTLPSTHEMTTVIYHKLMKKDTVINYISFSVSKKTSNKESAVFKFEYKQDSTFLLLNQMLPAFKLRDMNGKEISSTQLLGKPTFINFWAIYCGPCIAEMPQLSRLKERYKDKVNFVSITENSTADDHLSDFLKNKDFNFQVLDGGQAYKDELKIAALPRNLFIDKNGVLRYIQGNYPAITGTTDMAIDDKDNYFTKIIEELIKNSK
ncbi:Thiol-disulfide isomerase or thioredoxin [Pedobacter steynii]|uniref:Thiol-disulfide isomerase or thioredoxin n=1 Tax=Pedobacter steynii TaxID=430522 RepID=A0A1H0J893_9SPHI|nr:TlpA disulfide reductase family protein [Pedobacter steynii]NQX43061.1 TlpA family protein disulfide reductase [Pedobacter steynii]SDO39946.1 Thiol-disulfide isomerase or thioredoxin [Pedobacter steynii]